MASSGRAILTGTAMTGKTIAVTGVRHGTWSFGRLRLGLALAAPLMVAGGATAAEVKLAYVGEISGSGAVSGDNFRDGIILAVEEINAKGGILGEKIALSQFDTQSNPGISRALVQKALDSDPYALLGPVFSGSVKVNMMLAQQAGIPQFTGAARPADITASGQSLHFPHFASASSSACRRSPITCMTG